MEKKFLIEVENEFEKEFEKELNIEEFKKEVREDIVKRLDDERKTNVELDKRLYEVELDMFEAVMIDIK